MSKLKIFPFLGSLCGVLLFVVDPSTAQTVKIRLFEIFQPRCLEIYAEAGQFSANSAARHFRENTKNGLFIAAANAPLFDTPQSWTRITLTSSTLQIQSAGGNCSLPLADTVRISASGEAYWAAAPIPHEAERRTSRASFPVRPYTGTLQIYVDGNELAVINLVPVADYLAGILAAEMPQAELPAWQAQAVVSRTYMTKNWQRHAKDGYQFCDLTHCQTYKGIAGVTSTIRQAVASTADEILTFDEQPIEAYYSSTCGGTTADDVGVWANGIDQPYLKSIADESFCSSSPHYRWRARIAADSLHQLWQRRLGESIHSVWITKKGADGRVRELALMGTSLHLINGEDFRAVTCRAFGWNTLKSTAFDLRFEKKYYIFNGRGLGHGLGLCQYGAMEMARRGYSYREIVLRYFSEVKIRKCEK
ncbi:MAG: SpoIID/LytB domain-containing protein [candidate division KSB1 bacterium]|nr:SpoIID/LytB domain-containing protein [candidate division KSB1 bacterium]MDZ7300731.1 SpoIID/LytB domain-containing protein [candidate division KSB1 bacterium]MDZ7309999.1 SpoIID/LytB domain-containing protein [candidate division KSB1 bacterium]